ncbi:MAG: hypothetical protein JWN62_158 [Acidimicrobiales bacterium]|nr:hypothetical protein [Acidimicrobiales bacterium]
MIVASNTPQLEEAREEVHSLITRLLHNFAGSATSLVDHVRVTLDGRETPAVSSLRSGVEQLLEDGAWPFVKDLRNYIRHFRAPFLGHQVSSVETRRATFRWRTL